jgi:hypothetical protein
VVWEEKKVPIFVLEVVSHKRRGEYSFKKQSYQDMGVLYYAVYNPLRKRKSSLELYKLVQGVYQLQSGNPVWLPEVGLGIGSYRGIYQGIGRQWLSWFDEDGQRFPTPEEAIQIERIRAEEERQRAREAEVMAQEERQRAQDAEVMAQEERQRAQDAEVIAHQERQRAQEAEVMAQEAEVIAQQQRELAQKLAAKLRALGIDPDSVG